MTALENVLLGIQNQTGENLFNAIFKFRYKSNEYSSNLAKAINLLDFVGLKEMQNDLADTLSYGQQKLLSIACCMSSNPNILLLDEPVAGVQPAMTEKIRSVLLELIEQKKTVFLIEHDISFVFSISDTVIVMDDGKKIAENTPSLIKSDPQILEAYLS
jgi:ABC-type branched-subunit amino acid transport system ATPase component